MVEWQEYNSHKDCIDSASIGVIYLVNYLWAGLDFGHEV